MKIEKPKSRKARTLGAPGRKAAPSKKSLAKFQSALLVKRRENLREELDDLIVQIDNQAKELEKSMTFEELGMYKELVRKFISIAVSELYEVEEKLSISPAGKRKSMLIVKKIDTELEKLTSDFLSRQVNMLSFMGRLDEIRGLLMDLYT